MSKRLLKRHFGNEDEGLIIVAEKESFLLSDPYLMVYFTTYNTYENINTAIKIGLKEEQVKQLVKTLQEILKKWEKHKKGDA